MSELCVFLILWVLGLLLMLIDHLAVAPHPKSPTPDLNFNDFKPLSNEQIIKNGALSRAKDVVESNGILYVQDTYDRWRILHVDGCCKLRIEI